MMIHEITEKVGKYKARKRVGRGRGSGVGKTSGRGHKGAGSRSGYSRRPGFEGGQMQYFRRIPKRGFSNADFKTVYSIVNVASLQERFTKGDAVDVAALVEKGLVRNFKNPIKILGQGELSIALTITADKVSTSAQEAKKFGYLKLSDGITMNRDRLLYDAKIKAIELSKNFTPPKKCKYILPGETGILALKLAINNMRSSGQISDHDQYIGEKIAFVLSGGVTDITNELSEDDVLKLEKNAIYELIQNNLTLERLENILETGKYLRN